MIVEYHDLEIKNDRVIQELLSYVEGSWSQHYFMILGLLTKRHIEDVVIDKKDGEYDWLLAMRSSRKAHFSSRVNYALLESSFDLKALLKSNRVKSILCYETELSYLLKFLGGTTYEQTSYVMTRTSKLCQSHEDQTLTTRREEADFCMLSLEDLNEVIDLYRNYMPGNISEQDMIKLHQLGAKAYGIKRDNRLIAVAQVGLFNKNEAYVFGVLTVPEMRRKGLSMDLMRLLVVDADKMGITLHLLTNNPSAVSLYQKLSFEIKGSMYEVQVDYKEI